MKAVQINQYGGIDVLEINQDTPEPITSGKQILVEVFAASINPIEDALYLGSITSKSAAKRLES